MNFRTLGEFFPESDPIVFLPKNLFAVKKRPTRKHFVLKKKPKTHIFNHAFCESANTVDEPFYFTD